MKIAILNQPLGNRGDEAAHKAFVRRLANSLPDCQIDVIFILERQINIDAINVDLPNVAYLNITSLPYKLWSLIHWGYLHNTLSISYIHPLCLKFRHRLKRYDKVICAPGGMCMGGFKNWMHIWTLETAMRLHKPIFYWGRSIGPFTEDNNESKIFKLNSVKLLKYFTFTSLRDSISIQYANELGIKAVETVDSAFLDCPDAKVPINILREIDGKDYIVFVPNKLTWHNRYSNVKQLLIDDFYLKILEFIGNIYPLRKIVMLPQTFNYVDDDYSYFKHLSNVAKIKNIIVVDEKQNSDIQQKIISSSKLVIGARYHSIVFAINNNIPFISLSYEHKMNGLLEKMRMTESLVEIQDIFDEGNEEKYNSALKKVYDLLLSNNSISTNGFLAKEIVSDSFDELVMSLKS